MSVFFIFLVDINHYLISVIFQTTEGVAFLENIKQVKRIFDFLWLLLRDDFLEYLLIDTRIHKDFPKLKQKPFLMMIGLQKQLGVFFSPITSPIDSLVKCFSPFDGQEDFIFLVFINSFSVLLCFLVDVLNYIVLFFEVPVLLSVFE